MKHFLPFTVRHTAECDPLDCECISCTSNTETQELDTLQTYLIGTLSKHEWVESIKQGSSYINQQELIDNTLRLVLHGALAHVENTGYVPSKMTKRFIKGLAEKVNKN